jgi:hypothetical protein
LRLHGTIEKAGQTYRYHLTELGRRAVVVRLKLEEHLIVPGLHPGGRLRIALPTNVAPLAQDISGKGLRNRRLSLRFHRQMIVDYPLS